MTYDVFAVRDKAIDAFMQPFFARNAGEAMRMFADACNDEKGVFNRHAADYTLFRIGTWDDTSGLLVQDDKVHPEKLVSALDMKATGGL